MTRILVIEDETVLRNEVLRWLKLENYDAAGAGDGVEGLAEALRQPPDLIISDITMPRLDGYGVLLELHANPSTAAIPFVFVTARAAHEDMRTGMDLGADDYITKPFTREEFLKAIETRLGKKVIQDEHRQREVDQWQQAFEQEREQRLMKAKLVAMFSHDFRNPLASISSSISLLRHYSDLMEEERRIRHYDRMDASVRQLVQMLDDMLVVSKMEAGSFDFKPEDMNAQAFIQQIVEEFQNIHRDHISLTFRSEFSDTITSDSRLLRQVAANLISNAIKYSPQGGEVLVQLDHREGLLVLSVRDRGIGIPEEDQKRMFTAFRRASNVGNIAGTGLGLAIVKQATDLLQGTVNLESTVGMGTTVTVSLPC